MNDHTKDITVNTAWLVEQQDLTAARLAFLLREQGVDARSVVCAKIFPNVKDPTGGVLVLPPGEVFQFGFNRAGMVVEASRLDEWINISQTYKDHMWRDEILAAMQWARNRPVIRHRNGTLEL